MIDDRKIMSQLGAAVVKAGQKEVAAYVRDVPQFVAEIWHIERLDPRDWEGKLQAIISFLQPILGPIEKHWRVKGRKVKATLIFHQVSGTPGIQIQEPITGKKKFIWGGKVNE